MFLLGLWEVLKTGFLSFFKTIHTIQMGIIEILNPVNWFRDDWSINDVFEQINEVFDNAVAVGRAWEEGKEKGRESWRNKDKVPGLDKFQLDTAPAAVNKPTAVTATGGTSGKNVGLSRKRRKQRKEYSYECDIQPFQGCGRCGHARCCG